MVIEYFLEWVQNATTVKREEAARAMVKAFLKPDITDEEREDMDAALTILLDDRSAKVRMALAESFGAFGRAPKHIISALAADNPEIAMVVLSRSPLFHDSELVAHVRDGAEHEQLAISCRPWLSNTVISAICRYANKDASLGILLNDAIEIPGDDLHEMAERLGDVTEIRSILLERENLQARTRHLLIGKLGETLRGFLLKKSWLPEPRIDRSLTEACDRASIIFAANASEEEIRSVVQNLIATNRLNVVFLVRAICMGNIALVACSLSELSNIRYSRVETILTRGRQTAFKALYERAGLPKSAFIVFWTAISSWQRLLERSAEINQTRLPFLVIRDVMEAYSKSPSGISDELLVLLRRLAAETAREISLEKADEIASRNQPEDSVEAARQQAIDVEAESGDLDDTSENVANQNDSDAQEAVASEQESEKAGRLVGKYSWIKELSPLGRMIGSRKKPETPQTNAEPEGVVQPEQSVQPVQQNRVETAGQEFDLEIGVEWDEATGFVKDVDLSSYFGVEIPDEEGDGVSDALLYAPLVPEAKAA